MLNINVKLFFSQTDLMMYAPFAYEPLIFLRTQHLIYFSKIVLWLSFTSAQDIQIKYIALYDTKFIFTARPHAHAACAMEYFMKPMTKTSCIKETQTDICEKFIRIGFGLDVCVCDRAFLLKTMITDIP